MLEAFYAVLGPFVDNIDTLVSLLLRYFVVNPC